MTRKDYIALAAALALSRPSRSDVGYEQWHKDCRHIMAALAGDNPRFDRDRFEIACGMHAVGC